MELFFNTMPSPIGALKLVASDTGVVTIHWEVDAGRKTAFCRPDAQPRHPILRATEQQLREYFAGTRQTFSLPLDVRGTSFQKSVWAALLTIPFGETRTYGDIARQISKPTASRAVGAANGRNPIPIITPCHRVIGASGKLVGFAGGLPIKQQLLDLETRWRQAS